MSVIWFDKIAAKYWFFWCVTAEQMHMENTTAKYTSLSANTSDSVEINSISLFVKWFGPVYTIFTSFYYK